MYHALKQLDLKPYHMAEAMQQPSRDLEIAQEALKASRLGEGTPYGREEFDKWIGGFDVRCSRRQPASPAAIPSPCTPKERQKNKANPQDSPL